MLTLLPRFIRAACLAVTLPFATLPAQAPSDSAAVHRAMSDFLEALDGLDLRGMTTHFADDITAFVPSARSTQVTGKEAVSEIFRAFVDASRATPRARGVPAGMTVAASGGLGYASFSVPTPQGVVRRRTFIWRKDGSAWRIVHFHASDVGPPA